MMWLAAVCILGMAAGWVLLRGIPLCDDPSGEQAAGGVKGSAGNLAVSIIIPARNEERNLPRLLDSLPEADHGPAEVLVVDDNSTDRTAETARAHGARVVAAEPLASGWTGKTWACHQGAAAARNALLLFLDADTYYDPGGYETMLAAFGRLGRGAALSVLPYHVMERPYEQLSLFFHLLMVMGAGGWGLLGRGRLFGQSLAIERDLYGRAGGHEAVRRYVLENFMMARGIAAAGGRPVCRGGRGTLNMRFFPDGLGQLCEGWLKACSTGAADSDVLILAVSVLWLSGLATAFLMLAAGHGPIRVCGAVLYVGLALQLGWMARQIGNYRWLTWAVYPLPLAFYFGIFSWSLARKVARRRPTWRGREL